MGTTRVKAEKKGKKRVPRELIYEMRYGKPIYYRDTIRFYQVKNHWRK